MTVKRRVDSILISLKFADFPGLGEGKTNALWNEGIRTIQDLEQLDPNKIAGRIEGIGESFLRRKKEEAGKLLAIIEQELAGLDDESWSVLIYQLDVISFEEMKARFMPRTSRSKENELEDFGFTEEERNSLYSTYGEDTISRATDEFKRRIKELFEAFITELEENEDATDG